MSDLKASPGPWEPDFSDMYEITVKDAGGYDILKCIVEDEDVLAELHKTPSEQKAANAYLSAAAPDMYRLLFDILTDWPSITTDKELRISTLASIEEVLRKARGETK